MCADHYHNHITIHTANFRDARVHFVNFINYRAK